MALDQKKLSCGVAWDLDMTSAETVALGIRLPRTQRRPVLRAMLLVGTAVLAMSPGGFASAGSPGAIVTSSETLSGTVNGDGNGGLLIDGGTVTVENGSLANFTTTGGAGSGGGAGFGGAVMVNTNGTLVLDNVTVTNNTAIGGEGGVGTTGGSLNNLFNSGTTGTNGADGTTPVAIGEADQDGVSGSSGADGGDGTAGTGGTGGNGGTGTDGYGNDVQDQTQVIIDETTLIKDTADLAKQLAQLKDDEETTKTDETIEEQDTEAEENDAELAGAQEAEAADETALKADDNTIETEETAEFATETAQASAETAASVADFLAAGVGGVAAATDAALATEEGLEATAQAGKSIIDSEIAAEDTVAEDADNAQAVGDAAAATQEAAQVEADEVEDDADSTEIESLTTTVAADAASLTADEKSLQDFNQAVANGQIGIGGDGGDGGVGGDGSFGYGGGAGGNGGDGGTGASSTQDTSADAGLGAFSATFSGGAAGGDGGTGGNGGDGGFGAGGGSGEDGGTGGAGGVGTDVTGAAGGDGYGGTGGDGGFGGGNGSNGSGYNTESGGGGGGSAYGGAIFVNDGGTLIVEGSALFEGNNVIGGASANGGTVGEAVGTDLFIMQGATVNLDPGAGDYIIFDGTIADNSYESIGDVSGAVQTGEGGGLTIDGDSTGVVEFNGDNTYTGATVLKSGVLQAQDGSNINNESNITFEGGVLQSYGSFTRWLGSAANDVQWTVGTGGSDGGGFAAIGSGLTVTLNGGARLTWDSNYFMLGNGATLDFGSTTATANVTFTNAIDLAGNDANIAVTANGTNSDYAYMTGVLSDGSVTVGNASQTGVLVFTAANTYAGGTTIAGGTLALQNGGSLNANGAVEVDDGADFDISGGGNQAIGNLTGAGTVALGANTLTINDSTDADFSGSIVDGGLSGGTGGGVTIAGNAVQTFSGVNSYTGATTVASGADLALAGKGSIASSNVDDNGTFDISAVDNGGTEITSLSGDGNVLLGDNVLALSDASSSFSGNIGGAGSLEVQAGNETLTGANDFTGEVVTASGATLALAGEGTIADAAAVSDDGVFDISNAAAGVNITTLEGDGTVNLGANGLTLTNATTEFDGNIEGAGGVTVATGAQTFGGGNSYTGATNIANGAVLYLTGGGSVSNSSDILDNGVFDVSAANGTESIASLDGDGAVSLGANTLALTDAAGSFGGAIYGSGGVEVESGSEALTGASSYTGATNILSGATLALSGIGNIANSAAIQDDGTFDVSAADGAVDVTTLGGEGDVRLGANTLLLTDASTGFDGDVSGTGGLYVLAGNETLTGSSDYTGATGIGTGATLALAGNGNISASGAIDDEGTFDISGASGDATVATLEGNGDVNLGANTLILGNANSSYGGSIVGTGGLTIEAGTETLTGGNSYAGATGIDAGATLALSGDASVASSSVVDDQGMFDISGESNGGTTIAGLAGNGTVNLGDNTLIILDQEGDLKNALVGSGAVDVKSGNFTLLDSAETQGFTGALSVSNAAVTLGQGAVASFAGSFVLDNATVTAATPMTIGQNLDVDGDTVLNASTGNGDLLASNAVLLTGELSGQGQLTTNGNVADDGSGGVAGGLAVNTGTFEIGDASTPEASFTGNVAVSSGATLRGHGTVIGDISNNGNVYPGGSIGTLTVDGNYSQGSDGTLTIEVTPAGASDQLVVNGTATLGGTLATVIDGAPASYKVGTTYADVVKADSIEGNFTNLSGNQIYAGYVWLQPVYNADSVNLVVTASPFAYEAGNGVLKNVFTQNQAQFGNLATVLDTVPVGEAAKGVHIWGNAGGSFGGNHGASQSDYNTIVGASAGLGHGVTAGIAFAHEGTTTQTDWQHVNGDSNAGYGYAVVNFGNWQFSAAAGGGSVGLHTSRPMKQFALDASGNSTQSFFNAGVEARYLQRFGAGYVVPFLRFADANNSFNAFNEYGAGSLDIAYGSYRGNVTAYTAGMRLRALLPQSHGVLYPWAELSGTGYGGNRSFSVRETIGLSPVYETAKAVPDASLGLGAGLDFNWRRWSGNIAYHGQYANSMTDSSFTATLKYFW